MVVARFVGWRTGRWEGDQAVEALGEATCNSTIWLVPLSQGLRAALVAAESSLVRQKDEEEGKVASRYSELAARLRATTSELEAQRSQTDQERRARSVAEEEVARRRES